MQKILLVSNMNNSCCFHGGLIIILFIILCDRSEAQLSRFSTTVGESLFDSCLIVVCESLDDESIDSFSLQFFFNNNNNNNASNDDIETRYAIELLADDARGFVAFSNLDDLSLLANIDVETRIASVWRGIDYESILNGRQLQKSRSFNASMVSLNNARSLVSLELSSNSEKLFDLTTENDDDKQITFLIVSYFDTVLLFLIEQPCFFCAGWPN
jgi:hypothetical protein